MDTPLDFRSSRVIGLGSQARKLGLNGRMSDYILARLTSRLPFSALPTLKLADLPARITLAFKASLRGFKQTHIKELSICDKQ